MVVGVKGSIRARWSAGGKEAVLVGAGSPRVEIIMLDNCVDMFEF